jgi:hypothetical protein
MPTTLSTRISKIQATLGVPQTGVVDLATCIAGEALLQIKVTGKNLTAHIQAIQTALNVKADGIVGPVTISRVEALLSPQMPKIPAGASLNVSVKSLDMIVAFEVTSQVVYDKKYQSPIWPQGDSGITIGIGYDCGYYTKAQIAAAWGTQASAGDVALLQQIAGLKGLAAKNALPQVKSVVIPFANATAVFYHSTLPSFAAQVKKAFPGVEKLPPDAQGALLSLVYNRGAAIDDSDRRREMKNIVGLVAAGDLAGIAAQLRSMKRLWDPVKQKGLINRREAEAKLVEQATYAVLPENIVAV